MEIRERSFFASCFASWLLHFRHEYFAGAFVIAQSQEDGLAKLLVCSPFMESKLAHKFRLQVSDSSFARRAGKGRVLPHQRPKSSKQSRQRFPSKAGAHLPHETQLAIFMCAEQERSEMLARAFGRAVARDHKFFFLVGFYFQPFTRPACDIGRGKVLRDDSFE